MADKSKRLSTNVPGTFYVDSTCINCDTCRQLAPASFVESDDFSSVYRQPQREHELLAAYQALIACPVGSIGTLQNDKDKLQEAIASFPLELDTRAREKAAVQGKSGCFLAAAGRAGETAAAGRAGATGGRNTAVYYSGFNSEKSFGANSYFIEHPEGNWLIDSPRYMKRLVEAFERLGGIKYIFLTHEDDVADTGRYAKHFGATRIIHRADADAEPGSEWIIEGTEPISVTPEFRIIPVPGHTPGSIALLYADRYLFTGDHMGWDRGANGLRLATVYVWNEQMLRRSTARLLEYNFEWILPGHADRVHLPVDRMREELRLLLGRRLSTAQVD